MALSIVMKKKRMPFWKQKWFLMLIGLAVFVLFVINGMSQRSPDVLGASTGRSLWDTVQRFLRGF
jgi:hypothetical protein